MDVTSGELEDSMESFFLSETSKYLYLLQANTTDLPDYYVFTTEGHLLPPFAAANQQPMGATPQHAQPEMHVSWASTFNTWLPSFGTWQTRRSQSPEVDSSSAEEASGASRAATITAAITCAKLCRVVPEQEAFQRQQLLQAALPSLPLNAHHAAVLRYQCHFAIHIHLKNFTKRIQPFLDKTGLVPFSAQVSTGPASLC